MKNLAKTAKPKKLPSKAFASTLANAVMAKGKMKGMKKC